MPLGRFASYFLLLMTVGLVAFPGAVGGPPPADVTPRAGRLPAFCTEDPDGGLTCAPVDPALSYHSHHRFAPAISPEAVAPWRLEAGESAHFAAPSLQDRGREYRLLTS